jgi:xanthine dehydrogenase YagS FAD-binding subunit
MKAFTFVRPKTFAEAVSAAAIKGTVIKAGGIDLLDRMKERVDEPERVIALLDVLSSDAEHLLRGISLLDEGALLRVGALATLEDVARSDLVRAKCPALAEAAGLAASPQLRRRATIAGNLCQHTRCGYYRHSSFPCLKRGDASCPVLDEGSVQDSAGLFGNRPCASGHPSSIAPVAGACVARVSIATNVGDGRTDELAHFYRPPERGRASDTTLDPGDVVMTVNFPVVPSRRSAYEEVRQKAAFDWALVSCCVRLDMDGDKVKGAGVWLGSVAPTPWHAEAAEKALVGKTLTDETIAAAADAAIVGATPLPGNAYKVDLVKVVVRRALTRLRDMK